MNDEYIKPFLKWPGGKRWFVNKYLKIFPEKYNKYYEPFLGGGSVFFALLPSNAIIADINEELVNLYLIMRDNPNELRKLMETHQSKHSKEYYYHIRASRCCTEIEKAARFLYLNRTCYNGMYRVNRQGDFNVPIGTKSNCIYDIESFEKYSETLRNAEIRVDDFEDIINKAQENDLIFADPPYAAQNNPNGFIKYNDRLFTWKDQERLYNSLLNAKKRGAKVVITNVKCDEVYRMYEAGGFSVKEIERKSSIAGKSSKRGTVKELLITSYKVDEDEWRKNYNV